MAAQEKDVIPFVRPERHPIPQNRRSGGTDFDDTTLIFERAEDLADLIDRLLCENIAVRESGANVLVTPVTLLKLELEYLETAIHRLYENWHDPDDSEKPKDQHQEIVEEIREDYPDADERELALRVAIREHVAVAMAPHEEDETYKRLSNVVTLRGNPTDYDERERIVPDGDHRNNIPPELVAACDLFERLIREGEGMTVKAIADYLKKPGGIFVAEGDDDFVVTESNLARRGLSFVYAMKRIEWILRGVETEADPS